MYDTVDFELLASARAVPPKIVHSDEYDTKLQQECGTLCAATGVVTRHVCETESQIDLASAAAQLALHIADVKTDDIVLVIFAAAVPYQTIPATAPMVMQRLGIKDGAAAGFDVNCTCLSFLTGFETALHKLEIGQCALIVSAEIASRGLPWLSDPETAALFGDGAAAFLVRKGGNSRLAATAMATYPSTYDICSFAAGGTRFDFKAEPDIFAQNAVFQMDGKQLFRLTAKEFNSFVDRLLEKANWHKQDIDLVVPHQASPFALQHMVRQLGFASDQVVNIAATYGNQIAASMPFAFDIAHKDGRICPGTKLLFLGTSAGVSFGGMAIEF